jgi:hypothetical protein
MAACSYQPASRQASGGKRAAKRCPHCGETFGQDNLMRHIQSVHSQKKNHLCGLCGRAYTRKDHLVNHDCKRYNLE